MRKVFDSKNRVQKILDVEAAEESSRKASVRHIKPEDIRELNADEGRTSILRPRGARLEASS